MAYEYENEISSLIIDNPSEIDGYAYDEIKEVYRKARAWDNYITEVRERVRFTENTEDDIENETQKVIDYYMEDEWDGRTNT